MYWHNGPSKQKELCDSAAVLNEHVRKFLCSFPIIRKEEGDHNFQQGVYVNYEVENFTHLVDVMISLYDKVITNQPFYNVLWEIISSFYSLSFVFYSIQDELEHRRK